MAKRASPMTSRTQQSVTWRVSPRRHDVVGESGDETEPWGNMICSNDGRSPVSRECNVEQVILKFISSVLLVLPLHAKALAGTPRVAPMCMHISPPPNHHRKILLCKPQLPPTIVGSVATVSVECT